MAEGDSGEGACEIVMSNYHYACLPVPRPRPKGTGLLTRNFEEICCLINGIFKQM